jgi:hypothetical protein
MGSTQPREYNWEAIWKKNSGSGQENQEYGHRDPSSWPRDTFYMQRLAVTSLTNGGCSVGTVRSRTEATEFVVCTYKRGHIRYAWLSIDFIFESEERILMKFYTNCRDNLSLVRVLPIQSLLNDAKMLLYFVKKARRTKVCFFFMKSHYYFKRVSIRRYDEMQWHLPGLCNVML